MAGELITEDNQVQFGNLLMGPGTGYVIRRDGIEGWEDLPGFDATDVLRPGSDGAWQGDRYVGTRVVTVHVSIHPDNDPAGRSGEQLLRALQLATRVHLPEQELTVRMRGQSLVCWARINQRITEALSTTWMVLGEVGLPLQFLATDPRRYSVLEESRMSGPPIRSAGLQYAAVGGIDRIDYVAVGGVDRFDWGVDGSGGDIVATNSGTESTAPVVTFYGPCATPSVLLRHDEIDDMVLEYDLALVTGETLTVDARLGSVMLNGSSDRAYRVTAKSALLEEFLLPPGDSLLSFLPQSGEDPAAMSVAWRSAYL
ncbi:hypothetical protein [Streptodolium elevatio]|uniref:Phage tail protein n=1 Tax=Streptodolium elevatio TaxID=3157996 RepID=A0ABV3DLD6_9ACTN